MEFSDLLTTPSFYFDIICVILLIIFASRYAYLGLLAALVQICGTILSLFGAHVFANKAAPWVYETFFAQGITTKIESILTEYGTDSMDSITQSVQEALPFSLETSMDETWITEAAGSIGSDISAVAQTLVDSAIEPLVTQALYMLLFLVAFFVCRIFIAFLVNVLRVANFIPVLGTVNRALGWVVGSIGGLIDITLVLCVVWAIVLLSDGSIPVLNATDLESSQFYSVFRNYNPFM